VLHTTSRPQAWPSWLASQQLPVDELQLGAGFAHLYYLLEAAVAGLGVAIAPEPLVADDVASGRLLAPWGFAATGGQWALCTRHNHGDPRLDRLIAWLRRQLAR
jgi:Transcriptional regulator